MAIDISGIDDRYQGVIRQSARSVLKRLAQQGFGTVVEQVEVIRVIDDPSRITLPNPITTCRVNISVQAWPVYPGR